MILLNLRGKGEDLFWFSFFHEAYRFASETLISETYNPLIAGFTTKREILDLAQRLSLSPGIVAGRYQHLTGNWTHFNDLTRTFTWTERKESR